MGTMGGGSWRYQLPVLEGLSRGEGKAQHQEYNGVVRALSVLPTAETDVTLRVHCTQKREKER